MYQGKCKTVYRAEFENLLNLAGKLIKYQKKANYLWRWWNYGLIFLCSTWPNNLVVPMVPYPMWYITLIKLLNEVLYGQCMAVIPSTEKNQACLPESFKYFRNTLIIIDCTELKTDSRPQDLNFQRKQYLAYNHGTTANGLVRVGPNGIVTFVSRLYHGSTSKKNSTNRSQVASWRSSDGWPITRHHW